MVEENYIGTHGPNGGAPVRTAAILMAWLVALLVVATVASASTVSNQRPPLFSFDGSGVTAGKFVLGHPFPAIPAETAGIGSVAIDQATGDVYVIDNGAQAVDKFDPEGTAKNFTSGPAAGTSSLLGPKSGEPFNAGHEFFFDPSSDLAVDNSGGGGEGEQGRIYVSGSRGPVYAFQPNGERVPWSLPSMIHPCGIAVDHEGHVWVGGGGDGEVHEFSNNGEPAVELSHFPVEVGNRMPCRLGIDHSGGSSYVALESISGGVGEQGTLKYAGGLFDSTLTSEPTQALAIDQTAVGGHIFTVQQLLSRELESTLDEYEPCSSPNCAGTLLGSSGPGSIGNGRGVAYNPAKDWLYVPDLYTETVRVFGPRAGGSAPDVSEGETDEITKTEATVNGTINPAGLPNTYHFEWVKAEIQTLSFNSKGGTFVLNTRNPEFGGETTPIHFDVTAAELQSDLEAQYGTGNVSVSGRAATDEDGAAKFMIVFKNGLAGRFIPLMHGKFLEPFEEAEPYKGGRSPEPKFEVSEAEKGQLWAAAEGQSTWPESNPSIEPTDSVDHAVSLSLTGLAFNTTYDVRLVGTNTEPEGDPEKRLDAYSNADTFTTLPAERPTISELNILEVSATTAHLTATIDPREDETTWRVLLGGKATVNTSGEECEELPASAFEVNAEGTIPRSEPGTYPLDTVLADLAPGEIYCLRLVAVNSNPESSIVDVRFQTLAVPPDEVALAFAAPRTDTSARLNFYVDPEGESPLSYRFEISADGTSWTPLEELVSTVDAHKQIVLGEEATNLEPDTAYHYRLGLLENHGAEGSGGSAALPSEEGTFTTRTSAEMKIPSNAFGEPERRGFELVNNPDKGNQNARAAELYSGTSAMRADGEQLLWTVLGGAPGANNGTQATFLAKRTPAAGWMSQSLLPPASQQVGGGDLTYFPVAASPGFSSFIFAPAIPAIITTGPPTFVRINLAGEQHVLHSYQSPILSREDVSADTSHVLIVDPDTGKLEDIGGGSPEELGLIPPPSAPLGVPQPGGSPPACGLNPEGRSFIGFGGGGGAAAQFEVGYHRMSVGDASRVYFQVHPNSEFPFCNGKWALYERNREANPPTTTPVVPPTKGTSDTAIIRVTPDGRNAYFVTSAKLDPADTNSDLDIYRWDEAAGESTCLTCEATDDADVMGRVLISDDFSHIYFDSTKKLVPGRGIQGEPNLYLLSAGGLRYVASPVLLNGSESLSSDGNVLSFLSDQRLTSDEISPSCPDPVNGGQAPCRELFLYDDRNVSIECLSCRHHGTTANSVTLSSFGDPFKMTSDGSTTVFTTVEALVPDDVNSSADLYEWRNGVVRLVTDGVTHYPLGLAGPIPQAVDVDGSNLVFSVASPGLTGFERDGVANLYDARFGGGFPRPSSTEHCSEESCQGPLQSPPVAESPLSSSFHGPGNPPNRPHRCRAPKVRRHGRCVKRHHHRRRTRSRATASRGAR